MQCSLTHINDKLQEALNKRKEESLFRTLIVNEGMIDFCSNDYLSLARSEKIKKEVQDQLKLFPCLNGSTGSRSISGNTAFTEVLEKEIATFHHAEAGLLFNSGYDANVGLFSCIAAKGDTLICDELIHASIIDGCRLSYANRFKFAHNDLNDLKKKMQQAKGTIFVAVESVYSMDGDTAPLREIAALCERYQANLIVDEAHATGVFGQQGRGLVNEYGLEDKVFARVHTFGKALGAHGAVVVGSDTLRNYLINFARSFIFTTALPFSSLLHIKYAYKELTSAEMDQRCLHKRITLFKNQLSLPDAYSLIDSRSPVQSLIITGNEKTRLVAAQLQQQGFDVRAILSPSVPVGKERLRISLHLHNTEEQITQLTRALNLILNS